MNNPPPTGKINPAQAAALQRAIEQRTQECPAPTPPPLSDEELRLICETALRDADCDCPVCQRANVALGREIVADLERLGFTIARKP